MEQSLSVTGFCCRNLIPCRQPIFAEHHGIKNSSRRLSIHNSSDRNSDDRIIVRAAHNAGNASEHLSHLSCKVQSTATGLSDTDSRDFLLPSAGRRSLLIIGITAIALSEANAGAEEAEPQAPESGDPDTTITDKVFFDISLCPPLTRSNASSICKEADPLGRIVLGLYGKQVPQTVRNFKAMCTGKAGSTYQGTTFHKVMQGQYIQAGRQGLKERGEVPPPTNMDRNLETINPSAFKLKHIRPGTVSLCLAENDDEDSVKLRSDYRNVEFLITTGPGPVPQLDNGNIVFGTVLEGMDVVASLSALPTYKPSERVRQFNEIAELLGDDRAANARNVWDRPIKPVVISKCGELQAIHPSLTPTLP
ncbi:hypothetical protein O6H91_11G017300 [Diphasiastrum complanatum]|uniref:Uncharacterized protein n=1 Tax=Diphasiastrum complanatum TaxID=34168 RepID=A0ACC2C7T5_DIPCM|nr:hypothetical protein O6H91_Y210800 [Diphasiastrum complanatum]KAJ7537692.1 hypothetical protein O6H91_11G017300 [Diphasiastrum complanatum]